MSEKPDIAKRIVYRCIRSLHTCTTEDVAMVTEMKRTDVRRIVETLVEEGHCAYGEERRRVCGGTLERVVTVTEGAHEQRGTGCRTDGSGGERLSNQAGRRAA